MLHLKQKTTSTYTKLQILTNIIILLYVWEWIFGIICMKQSLGSNQIWAQKFKCKRVHHSIIYIILKILGVKNEITNKRGMDYNADT